MRGTSLPLRLSASRVQSSAEESRHNRDRFVLKAGIRAEADTSPGISGHNHNLEADDIKAGEISPAYRYPLCCGACTLAGEAGDREIADRESPENEGAALFRIEACVDITGDQSSEVSADEFWVHHLLLADALLLPGHR